MADITPQTSPSIQQLPGPARPRRRGRRPGPGGARLLPLACNQASLRLPVEDVHHLDGCQGLTNLPAEPSVVAAYLTERAGSGVSVATVQLSRAAIAAAHSDANLDDPCAHPGVRRTMSGLSRMYGKPPLQASPLTSDVAAAVRATARRPRRLPSGRMESESPPSAVGSSTSRLSR